MNAAACGPRAATATRNAFVCSMFAVAVGIVAACSPPANTPTIVQYPYTHESSGGGDDHLHGEVDPRPANQRRDEPGRAVSIDERWMLSHPQAAADLRNTEFGEREIREFWTRKGWRLTKREERYLAETQSLVKAGMITATSRWAVCPYTPVYQALQSGVKVMGVPVQRMQEFNFEMCENENEIQLGSPRFKRAKGYEEDHDEGHATDPSKKPHDH